MLHTHLHPLPAQGSQAHQLWHQGCRASVAVSGLCCTLVFVPCCYCSLGKTWGVCNYISGVWGHFLHLLSEKICLVFVLPLLPFQSYFAWPPLAQRGTWAQNGEQARICCASLVQTPPCSFSTLSLIKLGFSVVVAGSSVLTQLILVSNRLKCQCFNVLICGKKKIVGCFIYNLKRCCGKGLLVQDGKWQIKVQSSI